MRGFSSAGRAPALHAGGQEFESPNLHHKKEPFKGSFLMHFWHCKVSPSLTKSDRDIYPMGNHKNLVIYL